MIPYSTAFSARIRIRSSTCHRFLRCFCSMACLRPFLPPLLARHGIYPGSFIHSRTGVYGVCMCVCVCVCVHIYACMHVCMYVTSACIPTAMGGQCQDLLHDFVHTRTHFWEWKYLVHVYVDCVKLQASNLLLKQSHTYSGTHCFANTVTHIFYLQYRDPGETVPSCCG